MIQPNLIYQKNIYYIDYYQQVISYKYKLNLIKFENYLLLYMPFLGY